MPSVHICTQCMMLRMDFSNQIGKMRYQLYFTVISLFIRQDELPVRVNVCITLNNAYASIEIACTHVPIRNVRPFQNKVHRNHEMWNTTAVQENHTTTTRGYTSCNRQWSISTR